MENIGTAFIPDFIYGTAWKEERTAALVELAVRMGFRGIDTANQRRHYFEAGGGEGFAAAFFAGLVTRGGGFFLKKFNFCSGPDGRVAVCFSGGLFFLGGELDG